MTLQTGAAFELVSANDALSASPSERPAGFPEESRATCQITAIKSLRKLSFIWPGVGDVTFQLEPTSADVILTVVTHRRLADKAMTLLVGAGWHASRHPVGAPQRHHRPSFWSGWQRLHHEYAQRLAA